MKNSILTPKNNAANQDIIALVMKYYFYYHKSLKLVNTFISNVLKTLQNTDEQSLYEMFIRENIIMMESISDESTLLKLVTNLKHIDPEKIDSKSKVKFQDALYTLTRVGPPLHPTRAIRHESNETLDSLFPGGKLARFFLGATFRILHTWTWPKSFLQYILERMWSGITLPYRLFNRIFNPEVFQIDIEFDSDDIDIEYTKTESDTSDDEK